MQNARLDEAQMDSRFPGEISIALDMQMTPPFWKKVKGIKEFIKNSSSRVMKLKEDSEKAGLKLSIQKLRSWHLIPSLHSK